MILPIVMSVHMIVQYAIIHIINNSLIKIQVLM